MPLSTFATITYWCLCSQRRASTAEELSRAAAERAVVLSRLNQLAEENQKLNSKRQQWQKQVERLQQQLAEAIDNQQAAQKQ